MIKRYKKTNSGYMRRTSRIYLIQLNKSKRDTLQVSLYKVANSIRYFISVFWANKDNSATLADKNITNKAVERFGITARLAQCCAKQAKEIVRSLKEKSSKQTMPRFKNISINLDQRFFVLEEFKGSFEYCLKLSSGLPKTIIPFNKTKHFNKFFKEGWKISKSIRIGIDHKRLFIDIIFEKEVPQKKGQGEVLGIDLGFCTPLALSDKRLIGRELKDKIKKAGKRRKFHHFIETENNRLIKSIDLKNIRTIVLEDLKYVRHGKRGKFSRHANRLLSFWQYAKVIGRLKQLCEEHGVCVQFKSPWKTSQHCPLCGNIDRKNRNKEKFHCTRCHFEENADTVGAMNLKLLELAGAYSLRSLKNE